MPAPHRHGSWVETFHGLAEGSDHVNDLLIFVNDLNPLGDAP